MQLQRIKEALNLNSKESQVLVDYGYCDMIFPDESISEWQNRMKEILMEEEQMEQEAGHPFWSPQEKNMLINVLNRAPKS